MMTQSSALLLLLFHTNYQFSGHLHNKKTLLFKKLPVVSAVVSLYAFNSPVFLTRPSKFLCNISNLQPVTTDAITFIDGFIYMWSQFCMTLCSPLSADH